MELMEAIADRRSIRKFADKDIPREVVERILQAGILAPSSKNRQPWQFVVVSGKAKEEMLQVMREGFAREDAGDTLLPGSKEHVPAGKYTMKVMGQAPVSILVYNSLGSHKQLVDNMEDEFYEMANIQSVAACIQNMLLAAVEQGLGSLWICDVYFVYDELAKWLGTDRQLVAAIALGYPEQSPEARPRVALENVTKWLD